MKEVWKDIKGYEGLYQVSNLGRVKSLDRKVKNRNSYSIRKGRIIKLKLKVRKAKYNREDVYVVLSSESLQKKFSVARLVSIAFLPNPENLPQVNHKDENTKNNFVYVSDDGTVDPDKSNLEWCSCGYNINYGTRNNRVSVSMKGNNNNHGYMCPVLQFTLNGEYVKEYPTTVDASKETGVNAGNIWQAINGYGRRKTAGGFVWKYKNIA